MNNPSSKIYNLKNLKNLKFKIYNLKFQRSWFCLLCSFPLMKRTKNIERFMLLHFVQISGKMRTHFPASKAENVRSFLIRSKKQEIRSKEKEQRIKIMVAMFFLNFFLERKVAKIAHYLLFILLHFVAHLWRLRASHARLQERIMLSLALNPIQKMAFCRSYRFLTAHFLPWTGLILSI